MRARRRWQTFASVLGACIVAYFLYHTIQGERGWLAMLRLQNEVVKSQANLSQLQQDRKELDHRVKLMRPESMDPDLLDEKSRELLNYSKPNEIMVMTPPDTENDMLQRSKSNASHKDQ
jgi:cell division protein FtsB